MAGGILLRTWGGMGDILAALPIAWGLAESGSGVNVQGKLHDTESVLGASPDDFPHLPLLDDSLPYGPVVDLTEAWNWSSPTAFLDVHLARLGQTWGTTPRTACLLPPKAPSPVSGEYIVVCTEGRSFAQRKAFSMAQVAAVCDAGRRIACPLVLVGEKPTHPFPNGYDLRGATSIEELCAVVAGARCVVSTDTGVLHLAGAYGVPLVALVPQSTLGGNTSAYMPSVILSARSVNEIPAETITRSVMRMVRAARIPWCIVGPGRDPCGVAETGRIMAQAAGVPYRTYDKHDGSPCVVEYHNSDADDLHRWCDPDKTVLSVHRPEGVSLPSWGGAIFRSRNAQRAFQHLPRRSAYLPLHAAVIASTPRLRVPKSPLVMWHGQVHPHKGLREIIAAWQEARAKVPDLRLRIVGSLPSWWRNDDLSQWLRSLDYPGLEVSLKESWQRDEWEAALRTADIHIAFDTVQKEQSAVAPESLGYGCPVIVSHSSAFDDVRGWVVSCMSDQIALNLVKLATDYEAYAYAAKRAWMGAQYRDPVLLARTYRGTLVQAIYDGKVVGS